MSLPCPYVPILFQGGYMHFHLSLRLDVLQTLLVNYLGALKLVVYAKYTLEI